MAAMPLSKSRLCIRTCCWLIVGGELALLAALGGVRTPVVASLPTSWTLAMRPAGASGVAPAVTAPNQSPGGATVRGVVRALDTSLHQH